MIIVDKCRARMILNDYSKKGLLIDKVTNDLFKSRTLDDFMFNCVIKNNIPYMELPKEYIANVPFLVRVCTENPKMIEEIYAWDKGLFKEIVLTIGNVGVLLNSKLVSNQIKRQIKDIVKSKSAKMPTKPTLDNKLSKI